MQIYSSITFLIFLCIFDYLYIDVNSFYINQAVGGTGTLLCHGKPRYNAEVYLYDYDRFGKDDQLSNVHTDKKGYFLIQGYETEFLPIEPYIKVYHTCNITWDPKKQCFYRLTLNIPVFYIARGKAPKILYKFGKIELSKTQNQEMVCLKN